VYLDTEVTLGAGYFYRVTAVDDEMNESPASPETWIRATSAVPPVLALERVYPSPVRDQAVLRFAVPEVGPGFSGGVRVTLDLFDVAGRRVGRVIDGFYPPGVQEVLWTPGQSGRAFAPGIYVSVLRAAGHTARANIAIAR